MIRTPKNQVINVKSKGGTVVGLLNWESNFGQVKTERFRSAQTFVDSEVLRLMDPLTPMRGKDLIRSALSATETGEGLIRYNVPYARYHYYGKLMIGSAPKKLTDIDMTYEGAPERGPKWFERMKAQNKKAILKGAGEYINGKK